MRKLLLVCLLMLMIVPVAHAQETTPEAAPEGPSFNFNSICRIELELVAADLARAQGYASSGDIGRALTLLAEAESALSAIESRCNLPQVESNVPLGEPFAAFAGNFIFEYPVGWTVGRFAPNASGGGVFIGSTPTAAAAMEDTNPSLAEGEIGILVNVGNAVTLTSGANVGAELGTVLAYYQTLLGVQYGQGVQFQLINLEGRAAGRATFSGETFDGAIVIVEVSADRYAVVAGAARFGEGAGISDLVASIATTVR